MTALSATLTAVPALAQDAEPSPPPEPPGVEVTGFVDAYYGYNFNKVDPLLRSFDVQHNTLSLSLAEVALEKTVSTSSRLGFRIDVDFGKTADLVAAFEPEENGSEIYKNIQQAYLSVQAADKLTVDVGKFVTPIGAEVIESQDNWNYTRSILFGYAIPFYHVGLRATVAPSDNLSFSGFLVNGWNNGSETNGGKTVALSASVSGGKWSWIGNVMTGPEVSVGADGNPKDEYLTVWDTTLTLDAAPRVSLMGNFDYGTWKAGGQDIEWYGLAAYLKLQAAEHWALVGRYEWINDDDGFMTIGQKVQSFTLTSDNDVLDGLKLRLEYRLDKTQHGYFEKSDGTLTDSQSTLTAGVVYGFGGKI
jgi:opacity protein-like surface antigen